MAASLRVRRVLLGRTHDAAPDPRAVVAADGVDRVVPLDVDIPGCAPRPQAILNGRLVAMGVREARVAAPAR